MWYFINKDDQNEDVGFLPKKISSALLLCLALLLLCSCRTAPEPLVTADPYAGMVQVESGHGSLMWVKLYENVPRNTLDRSLFRQRDGFIEYSGRDYAALRGIDVSEHQQDIDWAQVKESGVEFAMIRAGYRGYSQGGLYEDPFFRQNVEGALENGIRVGVYFFSQAIDPGEAREEADFLLKLIADYDISMPVAYDWESIGTEEARTDNMEGSVLTECAVAFCEAVKQAGYDPAVYAYRYLAYFYYDLEQLSDYRLWVGAVGSSPDFYYRHDIWQYSAAGAVSGIEGDVDLNLMFIEAIGTQQGAAAQADSPSAQLTS